MYSERIEKEERERKEFLEGLEKKRAQIFAHMNQKLQRRENVVFNDERILKYQKDKEELERRREEGLRQARERERLETVKWLD